MATSHPYYLFGGQRRYPYAWSGGAGGVPQSRPAAETRGLGGGDLLESGASPYSIPYPAFKHTNLHDPTGSTSAPWSVGDWPLVRPAGREPLDPHEGALAGFWSDLSDNEQRLALLAVAAGLGWWLWKRRRGARRNPARARYEVHAGPPGGGRGMSYAMSFSTKNAAETYATSLRRDGRKARVSRR